jgi:hypothetical protein
MSLPRASSSIIRVASMCCDSCQTEPNVSAAAPCVPSMPPLGVPFAPPTGRTEIGRHSSQGRAATSRQPTSGSAGCAGRSSQGIPSATAASRPSPPSSITSGRTAAARLCSGTGRTGKASANCATGARPQANCLAVPGEKKAHRLALRNSAHPALDFRPPAPMGRAAADGLGGAAHSLASATVAASTGRAGTEASATACRPVRFNAYACPGVGGSQKHSTFVGNAFADRIFASAKVTSGVGEAHGLA